MRVFERLEMVKRHKIGKVTVGLLSAPHAARFNRLRLAGIIDRPGFRDTFMGLARQHLSIGANG